MDGDKFCSHCVCPALQFPEKGRLQFLHTIEEHLKPAVSQVQQGLQSPLGLHGVQAGGADAGVQ